MLGAILVVALLADAVGGATTRIALVSPLQRAAGICMGDDSLVLQRGHAACILAKRVDKPTDNGPARLLCYGVVDADSSAPSLPSRLQGTVGRGKLAPAHFPNTLHAPGARGDFDGSTRSRAEGGTGRRYKTQIPPRGITKGTEVACGCHHRVEPHAEP